MRLIALTKRIILQILHDKRTMALILFAPILVLTLINFILNSEDNSYTIGIINASDEFSAQLQSNEDNDITIVNIKEEEAEEKIKNDEIDAAVSISKEGNNKIYLAGADSQVASKMQMLIKSTNAEIIKEDNKNKMEKLSGKVKISLDEPEYDIDYVTGSEDASLFDKFGTQLIGIIIYFFVFLIAGINFLNERTSGTMEKLLSTPIRRYEIVVGYVLGFSILALLQSVIITVFSIYVLGITVVGCIWYVLLINLLTAICALTFGILLSTVANSEFQMMQFIPIVILPQVFLCGLFRIGGIGEKIGYIMPLKYTCSGLTEVMAKGNGIESVYIDVIVLIMMSVIFMIINILLLKKQRRI